MESYREWERTREIYVQEWYQGHQGKYEIRQIQEYEKVGGILYYQGRIALENQLKTQDLDRCKFYDFTEIGQPLPVILEDSPILLLNAAA